MIDKRILRFPKFKSKAVTFSYDDGAVFDRRLVEIFNNYGLKATFNLNSGYLSEDEHGDHVSKSEVQSLYVANGHEVAIHGYKHLSLGQVPFADGCYDVLLDKRNLESLSRQVACGMAYANGTYDDEVVDFLNKIGVQYARTTIATEKFDIPSDWLRMPTTCYHFCPRLFDLAKEFIETPSENGLDEQKAQLFFVWGTVTNLSTKTNRI